MEFKINNRTWKIVEMSQDDIKAEMKKHYDKPDELGKYFGMTYSDIQTIFLDKDLCQEQKRTTLLHELAHCYIESYITHLNKNYTDEDVCDIISYSPDIIREIIDRYFKEVK